MFQTVEEYIAKNSEKKRLIDKILKDCGNTGNLQEFQKSYIITYNECYLIFKLQSNKLDNLYLVDAIFTKEELRKKGLAQKLLKKLPKNLLFIFDTLSDDLKRFLIKQNAREKNYFSSDLKSRKQFLFSTSNNYSFIPEKDIDF
ncbi:hypothetical protein KKG81_14135 [bacterium]|jgi:hypothetical protein|nr:hypothetical protein [bacterium]